ncbi:MAG: hypothetical protein STSR0008_17540 [Ignavibacterium sp.]
MINKKFSLVLLGLILNFLFLTQPTYSQITVDNILSTDGEVYGSLINGNTLYINGSFQNVGIATGNLALIDSSTANPNLSFPKVDGQINDIEPDGMGGWFVAGNFNHIGDYAIQNLAHINSDFSVNTIFAPNPNYVVYTIKIYGELIYLGGEFTEVSGASRNCIASVNVLTGVVTSWNPNITGQGARVRSIAIFEDGSIIYAGGQFSKVGADTRNNLAAIDLNGYASPSFNPNPNNLVWSIDISGPNLFVGGFFTNISGVNRNYVAKISALNGTVDVWDANILGLYSSIFTIQIHNNKVYISGSFTSIGGASRNNVAALDFSTGSATSWNPNLDAVVHDFLIVNDKIYLGGNFTSVGGQNINYLAVVDSTNGTSLSWNPNLNASVSALATAGSNIIAGGYFILAKMQPRNYLAAFNTTTGELLNWNPNPNGYVYSMVYYDSKIYLGGEFTNVGGIGRNYLGSVDAITGNAVSFNPNPNNIVFSLAISGSTLYTGGFFSQIDVTPRNYLASFELTSGNLTNWDPEQSVIYDPNNGVAAITIGDTSVYVGGVFTQIGDSSRNNIAEIGMMSGKATNWNPNADNSVITISIDNSSIYAGGYFSNIGDSSRNNIASLDKITGKATDWNPNPNNGVRAIASSDSYIYVGGYFDNIAGQTRNGIASFDKTNGNLSDWNLNLLSTYSTGSVNTISLDYTNKKVFIGGYFSSVNNNLRFNIAGVTNPDDPLPVELTTFLANVLTNGVELKWQTATEVNNYGFEVLRSAQNDENWVSLGFVNGNGNSNSPKDYSFVDEDIKNQVNGKYYYRLKQIDTDGSYEYSETIEINWTNGITDVTDENNLPKEYSLSQNYPNPFNPTTTLSFAISQQSFVSLKVYDVLGKEVATLVNEEKPAGTYKVTFDAGKLSSGVYFYKLQTGNFVETKKMILLR